MEASLTPDEILGIAQRMSRHRARAKWVEEATQEAALRGWQLAEQGKNKNYVIKSMKNRLIEYSMDMVSKERLNWPVWSFDPPKVYDLIPSELSWVEGIARDHVDQAILLGVLQGMKIPEVARTWGRKRWDSYLRPQLEQAYKNATGKGHDYEDRV